MALRARFDGRFIRLIGQAVSLFNEFNAIDEPINTPVGLKARVSVALKALRAVAEVTDSTNDDNLVASLETLLANDELIALVAMLIDRFDGSDPGTLVASIQQDASGAALIEELNARGINWTQLLTVLLPLIQQLIEIFGSKGGVNPPAPETNAPGFGFDNQ